MTGKNHVREWFSTKAIYTATAPKRPVAERMTFVKENKLVMLIQIWYPSINSHFGTFKIRSWRYLSSCSSQKLVLQTITISDWQANFTKIHLSISISLFDKSKMRISGTIFVTCAFLVLWIPLSARADEEDEERHYARQYQCATILSLRASILSAHFMASVESCTSSTHNIKVVEFIFIVTASTK